MKISGTLPVRWAAQDGAPGVGVSIRSTLIQYAQSNSGSVTPTTGWSTSIPQNITQGNYLWTWTRVEYSDNTVTNSYSVSRMGIDGKGIKSSTVTYSKQSSSTVDPTTITDWGPYPTNLQDGDWLYSKTHIVYSGTPETTSDSYSVSRIGVGAYYTGMEEYYASGASDSSEPTGYITPGTYPNGTLPTPTWTQTRPNLTPSSPYLWNQEISHDSQGNSYVMPPVCIGNFANGLTGIAEDYAISQYSDKEGGWPSGSGEHDYPADISSWTPYQSQATPSNAKPYQWNRTTMSFNKGSDQHIYHISAVKGADGQDAIRLDLDNEMDTMVYNESGTLISGSIESQARLYRGGTLITSGVTFAISERSGNTSSQSSITNAGKVTVTGINSSGFVKVRAEYGGVYFYATLALKKIIGENKYELVVSPDSVAVNTTTGEASADTIEAQIYKTYQNSSGGITREHLTGTTVDGHTIKVDGVAKTYSGGKVSFSVDTSRDSHTIELYKGSVLVDYETVPINKSANGQSITGPAGKNAKSVYKVSFDDLSSENPSSWDTQMPNLDELLIKHSGDWVPIADGWHRAPYISHNGWTEQRIQFTTTRANQKILIQLQCVSESSYDEIAVGNLDAAAPHSRGTSFFAKTSGGSISSPAKLNVGMNIETPGAHSIGISFYKDSSFTADNEYAMFRVGVPPIWKADVVGWNGDTPVWGTPVKFVQESYSIRVDEPHPNILRQTEFVNSYQMNKWLTKNGDIILEGYSGHNSFYGVNSDTEHDKEILLQRVYESGSINILQPDKWYTLSFFSKGVGTLCTYFYPSASGHMNTAAGMYRDGIFTAVAATDCVATFELHGGWEYHTVTFKTASAFSGDVNLLFRLLAGSNCNVNIACPKLEQSSMATEYSISEPDVAASVVGESGFLNECGVYDHSKSYKWDEKERDYVYHIPNNNTQYKVYFVKNKGDAIPADVYPTSDNGSGGYTVNARWEEGNELANLIANSTVITNALIGGFKASNSIFKSDNERVVLDGANNIIKVLNAALTANIAAMGDVNYPFYAGGASGAAAVWSVDKDGKMRSASAEISGDTLMTDALIKRARNPFVQIESSFSALDDDTMYNNDLANHLWVTLGWDVKQAGRRIVVVGSAYFQAPANSNQHYYVDGKVVQSFQTSFEMTELIGFGTATQFLGWIVTNRVYFMTNRNMGRKVDIVAYGIVQGTDSRVDFVTKKICYSGNGDIYVERADVGIYFLHVPRAWFASANYVHCMVCGRGSAQGAESAVFANVWNVSEETYNNAQYYKIQIFTADDASRNDGGFYFELKNLAAWDD